MTSKRQVREGIGTLYRRLAVETVDKTYEKERMRVMQILSLLPKQGDDIRPASANLGLYARKRPKNATDRKKRNHLPNTSKEMIGGRKGYLHSPCEDDPSKTTCDHRETCSPYGTFPAQRIPTRKRLPYCLQQNPLSKPQTAYKCQKDLKSFRDPSAGYKKSVASETAQKRTKSGNNWYDHHDESASKWSEAERKRLNELYWELGKPKRSGQSTMDDHLSRYVHRHQILYKDRPAKEIKDRVRHMFQYNQFKEVGEEQYWVSLQK